MFRWSILFKENKPEIPSADTTLFNLIPSYKLLDQNSFNSQLDFSCTRLH